MARYTNAGDETVVFRDDSGKRFVAPGQEFDLVGEQHAPVVEALPGVERILDGSAEPAPVAPEKPQTVAELRERAEALGLDVPTKPSKAVLEAAIATHEAAHQGGIEPADDLVATAASGAGGRL